MFAGRACRLRFFGRRAPVLGGRPADARSGTGAEMVLDSGPDRKAPARRAADSGVGCRVRPVRIPRGAAMPARRSTSGRAGSAWRPALLSRSAPCSADLIVLYRQQVLRTGEGIITSCSPTFYPDGRLVYECGVRLRNAATPRADHNPDERIEIDDASRVRAILWGLCDLRIRGHALWTDRAGAGAIQQIRGVGRPLTRARASLRGRRCRSDSRSLRDRHGRMLLVRQRVLFLRPGDRPARRRVDAVAGARSCASGIGVARSAPASHRMAQRRSPSITRWPARQRTRCPRRSQPARIFVRAQAGRRRSVAGPAARRRPHQAGEAPVQGIPGRRFARCQADA